MARQPWMPRFAKWHIWLGWLVGFPILMWLVTGLVMVARPIEVVRGEHLRVEQPAEPLPAAPAPVFSPGERPVELRTLMQRGTMVTLATYADGRIERFTAQGNRLPPLTERDARLIVRAEIKGGNDVAALEVFPANATPFDFRRPMPVWRATLADGTRVYVGRETGQIEAVRTRWWRLFDFVWGLHIMDLQTREDTSHPILILFAALATVGALLGTILMFRRRKARVTVDQTSSG